MRTNRVLLIPLCASLASAATLTSGTLVTNIGDQAGAGWALTVSGPGIQLGAGLTNNHPGLGVPLCTATCTYNFSGTISPQFVTSFVLNGLAYQPNQQGYVVSFSFTFTGTEQTVTAVATGPPPGRPGPIDWETTWPANPFTMNGSIAVIQQTSNGNVPILTENISGQGFTTGYSWVSQQAGPWNYSTTIFTFIPESSAFLLAATGLLAIATLRRRG